MRSFIWGGFFVSILAGIGSALADEASDKKETKTEAKSETAVSSGTMTITTADGQQVTMPVPAGGMPAMPGGMPIKPGEMPPGMVKPGEQPGKPGDGGKKPGEGKPDDPSKPFQHPMKPATPPNPAELKVRPTNGKVAFNFTGQPWPDVLQWLADISGTNLDYQELPGDFLNYTTDREYTVPEVRDLFNQLLMARGYTILTRGKTLSVANLEKLDLSLVPRVEPEELDALHPYDFVKVSFPLTKMTAEAAVEELKPMMNKGGKLIPLKLTNRLEAVGAAVNLREIHNLLCNDQSPTSQKRDVQEFKLQHARADDVKEQLEVILKDKGSAGPQMPGQGGQPGGMTPEMMQQIQEQQRMMMARQGGNPEGGSQPGQPGKAPSAPSPVSLVVNSRNNSIVAYAPADKMALIDQVIKMLDVPGEAPTALMANVNRTQVYRLIGVDPDIVVSTLRKLGNLDPTTDLQVDKKTKAIIVTGSLADHAVIAALVQKLSGSERRFEVKQLRRLAADYVAGTVEFMINGEKKEKSRRSSYFFDGFSSRNDREETNNTFRVDADVENNRLLLWANDVELGEVESLLRKLGEIPADNSIDRTIRVIDASGEKDARELLRQIQQAWPSISPNPLQDNSASTKENSGKDDEPSAESSTTQYEEIVPDLKPATPIKLAQIVGEAVEIRPAEAKSAEAMPAKPGNPPAKKTPPIKIDLTPDGRIVATSDDPKALDLFEDLAGQLIEDRKEYKVFRLKYCVASDIKDILDDFFKTEPKKEQRRYPPWWYDDDGSQNKEDPARLSKKRPIKFIADSTTNSILVQGADAKQLRTIQELIAVYNQPTPSDSQSNRVTESVHLEYSKADVVADTVKEVYRDLLSTNDKAFGKKDDRDSNRGYFWGYDSEDSSKKEQKTPKFKGLLSIGVDEVSNTVVVSAPAYLFEQVKGMILELDKAAAPASTTRVIKLGPGMRGPDVQKRLLEALGQDTTKEEPDDKKTPPEGNGEPKKEKKNGKKKS